MVNPLTPKRVKAYVDFCEFYPFPFLLIQQEGEAEVGYKPYQETG
jgi:hypothetical protein